MKNSAKVGIGAGAAVVILGGGMLAYTLTGANDVDLATAAPQGSAAYMELNLDPSVNQKIASLSLSKKIASLTGDDEIKDKSVMESLTKDDFPGLDFEREIKPWIGDQAAGVSFDSDLNQVTIYEIKDKAKAEDALKKVTTKKKSYEVKDKWIVVANNQKTLDNYLKKISEGGNLSDSEVFKKDRKVMDDNVAFAWMDLHEVNTKNNSTLSEVMRSSQEIGINSPENEDLEVSGRLTASVKLNKDSVDINAKSFDLMVNGESNWGTQNSGAKVLPTFTENTVMAFEAVDLSNSIKDGWTKVESDKDLKEGLEDFKQPIEQSLDIKIPDEIEKILGSSTAFALNDNNTMELKAEGADSVTWEKLYELTKNMMLGLQTEGETPEIGQLSTEDNMQRFVLDIDKDGDLSDKKLSDSETFKKSLPELDKAQVAGYADLKKVSELNDSESEDDVDEGAVGFTMNYDKDAKQHNALIRWVLR